MATTTENIGFHFQYVSPGNVLAAGIILPILNILFVALRFYVRRTQKERIGIDDWLSIPSAVLSHVFSPPAAKCTSGLTNYAGAGIGCGNMLHHRLA
jgi:O-antigen/teichoic acid export membrane protein